MDFNTIKTNISHVWSTLLNDWTDKLLVGSLTATFQLHAELITAFTVLIFLDLFTKWIALAKPLTEHKGVWEEIQAIPEAHRRGIISSYVMRTKFVEKIIMYLIVVLGSSVVDFVFRDLHVPAPWTQICIGYLAAVEFKSVLENLNDAGVEAMNGLIEKIDKKGK